MPCWRQEADVSFAASTPQGGGGGGKRYIIRNELRLGCKEGALDALHFHEATGRTECTLLGWLLIVECSCKNGITINCHVPRTEVHFSTVKMSPNKFQDCKPSRRQMSLESTLRSRKSCWWNITKELMLILDTIYICRSRFCMFFLLNLWLCKTRTYIWQRNKIKS